MRPRVSLSRRKPNRPASGSGPSANHCSIAGSSAFWIVAVRVTPLVSASRLRSAACGSAYPSAARRSPAASDDSRTSGPGIWATASSSGR